MPSKAAPAETAGLPHFHFPLGHDALHMLCTPEDVRAARSTLLRAQLVGIDTETRPQYTRGMPPNPVALLQVAVRLATGEEQVFLFDLLALRFNFAAADEVLCELFQQHPAVKLGLGLYADFVHLRRSYPCARCFQRVENVVEVNALARMVDPLRPVMSLQRLAGACLRVHLPKAQQMSNWARRPLTVAQMHYAANDALVLLRLHDALMQQLRDSALRGATASHVLALAVVLTGDAKQRVPCAVCSRAFSDDDARHMHWLSSECSSAARKREKATLPLTPDAAHAQEQEEGARPAAAADSTSKLKRKHKGKRSSDAAAVGASPQGPEVAPKERWRKQSSELASAAPAAASTAKSRRKEKRERIRAAAAAAAEHAAAVPAEHAAAAKAKRTRIDAERTAEAEAGDERAARRRATAERKRKQAGMQPGKSSGVGAAACDSMPIDGAAPDRKRKRQRSAAASADAADTVPKEVRKLRRKQTTSTEGHARTRTE